MRKLFSIILLFCTMHAYSQQAAAPTKLDAINFLKKIYTRYAGITYSASNYTIERFDIREDSCMLIMELELKSKTEAYLTLDKVTIDLSSVKHIDEGRGSRNSSIIPLNTKISIRSYLYNKRIKTARYALIKATDETEYFPLDRIIGPLTFEKDDATVVDNNYAERIEQAWDFLIKACGGGKTQKDTEDKF